jgi:putative membrane-bound dehydrogenase-like protein
MQPDIWFQKDSDGDDHADVTVRQLVGFDSADSHHGIAAFEWGPDGGLYFQEGTFKYSQVETNDGVHRLAEGGVWRYDPRTQEFQVHVSFAFANPWGHCFDRWGQNFIGDASPGKSYWATPISGHIGYPEKHPGGAQHKRVAGLIGGDPKYEFPTFYEKRTRPLAGCAIVSSRHFPDDVQGNFLVTNVIGDRAVLNHRVTEEGSGFVGTEVEPIIACDDGNFRPVDIQFAPDGSLYVVDWHNALIGHLQHNLRDPSRDHSHGRIWRITHKHRPLIEPAKIDGEPISALLELLKLPEDRTRYRARRELADRDSDEVISGLTSWIASLDRSSPEYEHQLLEALWMQQTHNRVDQSLLQQLLSAKDHRARAAATRVLAFTLSDVPNHHELLEKCISDEHPRVRLEAVRAVSFMKGDEAIELALGVLEYDMDDYLQYTLDETMRALEQ